MSTTPRTDAVWADKKQNILEHSRQLELENIKLLEVARAAKEYHGEHSLYIDGRCSLCDAIKSLEESVKL